MGWTVSSVSGTAEKTTTGAVASSTSPNYWSSRSLQLTRSSRSLIIHYYLRDKRATLHHLRVSSLLSGLCR